MAAERHPVPVSMATVGFPRCLLHHMAFVRWAADWRLRIGFFLSCSDAPVSGSHCSPCRCPMLLLCDPQTPGLTQFILSYLERGKCIFKLLLLLWLHLQLMKVPKPDTEAELQL